MRCATTEPLIYNRAGTPFMALASGTRLGPYEVISALGAGGMGEVYRARDTRLGREVALKILPDLFAGDAERIQRFEREAQALAALNHPHIAQIHGIEDSESVRALVMELVEGESLATRLARGAIPIDEAIPIARQIVDALEAAHEKGIIHRDLKPANIMLTPDAQVKVLDFGLAKIVEAEAGAVAANSPTLTFAATQAGVVLGTAAYMSPEQAKGRTADKRSDVWALGCVIFEMLAGTRAFEGEDVTETLAAVIRGDPNWSALPSSVPPAVTLLLRRCLEKDRRRRIADVSTLRFVLDEPWPPVAPRGDTGISSDTRRPAWMVALAIVGLITLGVGAGMFLHALTQPSAIPPVVTRFSVMLSEGLIFTNANDQVVAVSSAGDHIAYVANRQLYLRSMGDLDAQPVRGTDVNPRRPMFSPDGSSLAYFSADERALKRISIAGGAPVTVLSNPSPNPPFGGSWSGDSILFGSFGGPLHGIARVPAAGGKPEVVVTVDAEEYADGPQMLPDGEHVLFTLAKASAGASRWDRAQIVVQSIKTSQRHTLIDGGSDGRYLTTGHLLYALSGVVLAVRFDAKALRVVGGPVPVIEGVRRPGFSGTGGTQYSVSNTGTLVFVPGPASTGGTRLSLALIDRKGSTELLKLAAGAYRDPRISPDGKQVAFGTDDGIQSAIWVYALSGASSMRRLTLGGRNRYPVWSPDGRRIAFQSDRAGDAAVFVQPADGSGTAERLTTADKETTHIPESWSPDGKSLLVGVSMGSAVSLAVLSVEDKKITPFGDVRSTQPTNATFSPDGKWVAYTSNSRLMGSSGEQIYVQPFPPTGATYQITKDAGHHPFWSRDGKELYYMPGAGRFSVVTITTRPSFTFSEPLALSRGSPAFIEGGSTNTRQNDATLDGRVVGVISPSPVQGVTPTFTQFQVVLNWFHELEAKVPRGQN